MPKGLLDEAFDTINSVFDSIFGSDDEPESSTQTKLRVALSADQVEALGRGNKITCGFPLINTQLEITLKTEKTCST